MNSIAVLLLTIIAVTSLGRENVKEVHMIGMNFVPKTITISKGDKIRFINDSKIIHDAVFDFARSPFLKQGESYEVQFDSKGEYKYICSLHVSMGMVGKVIVKE